MYSARCPVCDDLISPGVAVKQNQVIICPTCLANLQVVSVSPLEFEEAHRTDGSKHYAGSGDSKKVRMGGRERSLVRLYGGLKSLAMMIMLISMIIRLNTDFATKLDVQNLQKVKFNNFATKAN